MNRSDDYLDHAGSALAEPDAGHDDSAAKEVERLQKQIIALQEANERLFANAKDHADTINDLGNQAWEAVYGKGRTDWEYPMQAIRHLSQYAEEWKAKAEALAATLSSLTAERDRYRKALEHYADTDPKTGSWDGVSTNVYLGWRQHGWAVAREALKGGEK